MNFRVFGIAVLFICITTTSVKANSKDSICKKEQIKEWLVSDLWSFQYPVFKEQANIKGESFSVSKILELSSVDMDRLGQSRPFEGSSVACGSKDIIWRKALFGSPLENKNTVDSTEIGFRFLCTYFTASDFEKISLSVKYASVYELFLDGKKVISRSEPISDTGKIEAQEYKSNLEPGFHTIIARVLVDAKTNFVLPEIEVGSNQNIALGLDVPEYYDLQHYLFEENVSSLQLSNDGQYFILRHTKANDERKSYDSWYSLRRSSDGKVISFYDKIHGFSFADNAPWYGYMSKKAKKTAIYVGKTGETASLVYETSDNISNFTFDPSANYLVLGVSVSPKKNKTGLRSLSSAEDHLPYYKNRTSLFKLDLRGFKEKYEMSNGAPNSEYLAEMVEPLTYGSLSTDLYDISQDGSKILFSTSESVDTIRDYSIQKMYILHLGSMKSELLWTTPYMSGNASFSPDGKYLFVAGSQALFSSDSSAYVYSPLSNENMIINDYNSCAFVYDIAAHKPYFVGEDFDPSINTFYFEPSGRYVYIMADDKDEVSLYAYQMGSGIKRENGKEASDGNKAVFSKIPVSVQVLQNFDIRSDILMYIGSSADQSTKVYIQKGSISDLKKKKVEKLIYDPQKNITDKKVKLSSYIDLRFATPFADSIDGTIYLPYGLSLEQLKNEGKKYPCITYYYGGTAPTPKGLAFRYPKQVWASRGYVVLVLQPSGAIGYGAEFAAKHVNNWGKTVADEIISAVKESCNKFEFIDSNKIGCIGASYGGFMTQLLVTRTNLFSAAISHAGISSISSYWGEGYWGYMYNSVAAANSFPWNRKDIYVDQSPLFSADKVNTPLLLLHGTSDNNVPIGESYQMFKALRLLGRPVAMVTVEGEDHGIVDLAKRIEWEKTILAWFDKYLKGNPSWWESLYGEK